MPPCPSSSPPLVQPTAAVCWYGLLPRTNESSGVVEGWRGLNIEAAMSMLGDAVMPSMRQFAVEPLVQAGFRVRTFGHTWLRNEEQQDAAWLRHRLHSAVASSVRGLKNASIGSLHLEPARMGNHDNRAWGAFLSIEALLRLSEIRCDTPDWVLMMRWDMLLWSALELPQLDNRLFYVANWCTQRCDGGSSDSKAAGLAAVVFPGSPLACSDDEGVPDFYYASSHRLMQDVFDGLVDDLRQGVFQARRCCCGHGIMSGRLSMDAFRFKVGRYLWHLYDYTFVRGSGAAQHRCMLRASDGHGMRWSERRTGPGMWTMARPGPEPVEVTAASVAAYDVKWPQRGSVCPQTLNNCLVAAGCMVHHGK